MLTFDPSTTHYVDIDGTIIFLNVDENRFFALTPDQEEDFRRSIGKHGADAGACTIFRSPARGLRRPDRATMPSASSIATANAAFRESERPKSYRILVEAMCNRLSMKRLVRQGNLKQIHEKLRAERQRAQTTGDPQAVFRVANSAFSAISSIINAESDCLALASARAKFILRRGIPVNCILGVRLNPFSAHAWVQYKDLVIGDDVDFVRIHSPIAAL